MYYHQLRIYVSLLGTDFFQEIYEQRIKYSKCKK